MLLALALLSQLSITQFSASSSSARLLPDEERSARTEPVLLPTAVPLVLAGVIALVSGGAVLGVVLAHLGIFELAAALIGIGFVGGLAVVACLLVAAVFAGANAARLSRAAASGLATLAPGPSPEMLLLRF